MNKEIENLVGPSPDRALERALRLGAYVDRAFDGPPKPVVEGVLRRSVGMALEAEGCSAPVGGRCDIVSVDGKQIEAEVVGFAGDRLYLMPTGDTRGIVPNARVIPVAGVQEVHVGDGLLGRVLDGRGKPLDGGTSVSSCATVPLFGKPINPLERRPIRNRSMSVSVPSIPFSVSGVDSASDYLPVPVSVRACCSA
jgi:flagellum-specific ATP synthase